MPSNYDPNRYSTLAKLIYGEGKPKKPATTGPSRLDDEGFRPPYRNKKGPEWYQNIPVVPGNPYYGNEDIRAGRDSDPHWKERFSRAPTQLPAIKPPEGTKVDWKFMNDVEGYNLDGYVPVNPDTGDFDKYSGATVATGVDLGGKDETFLKNIGLTTEHSLYWKLKPHLGLKGADPTYTLAENPLLVTDEEAKWLNGAVKVDFVRELNKSFLNSSQNESGRKFTDLPSEAQTAVFSVAWHKGIRGFNKAHEFKDAAVTQNWNEAYNELLKMANDPKQNSFKERRLKEADLLYNGIMGGVDEI